MHWNLHFYILLFGGIIQVMFFCTEIYFKCFNRPLVLIFVYGLDINKNLFDFLFLVLLACLCLMFISFHLKVFLFFIIENFLIPPLHGVIGKEYFALVLEPLKLNQLRYLHRPKFRNDDSLLVY